MKYQIKDADGDIYTFNSHDEVLEALCRALGTEHSYKDVNGEWIESG